MIHKRARARFAGLLAAATAAGMVVPAVLGAPGAAAAPGPVGVAPTGPTVTLLTGDKVTIGGPNGVSVRAAEGREHISFHARTDEHGDMHVIPADAASLVSSGRLDPRLFDVTELVAMGYDDASRPDLPLIVDYPGATPRAAGATVLRELPALSATAVRAERSTAFWATARDSAQRIWLDGPVRASLDQSVPQIGAPQAWEAGHTGEGTTVAVLDTGIDATHPELADAVAGEQNFTDADSATDKFGHGTHVASIITGEGEKYRGVAPDAKLLNGKVLDDNGGGYESWIIAGMEWAATGGADVINMSLGSPSSSDGTDPMSQAVNQLTAETGVLFVIAAGNSGPSDQSIGSPAAADAALTVGAVDREDQLAEFSSRGPRFGDDAIKPDITAPGVDIVAAKAKEGQIGDPVDDSHVSLSGTSMATPHVAGAAAILAGQHPDWTAEPLKASLMGSAIPNDGLSVYEQGAGRVDVAAAVRSTVSASPASISNGTVQWPHDDDEPIAKTLTYTNSGTEEVTLDLATDVRDPDGNAAPQGMFTVEPSQLTIPAGGQASATLTTDTKVEAPDGLYGGVLTATGGDTVVRTPVGVTREVESYNVTLNFLDHDGAATGEYGFRFVDVNNPKAYFPYDESGTVVARLPKGEFYFEASVATANGPQDWLITEVNEPAFTVTGDAELTVDAREGKPVGFTVEAPNAKQGQGLLSFLLDTSWGGTGLYLFTNSFDGILVRPSTTSAGDAYEFTAEARMAEPDGTGEWPGFGGSPYLYHLRHSEDGGVPGELRWRVTDRQLAKVTSKHAVDIPNLVGLREQMVFAPLPYTLTEFYTPNTPWYGDFMEVTEPDEFPPTGALRFTVEPRTFERGKATEERWNAAVFGPALPYESREPAYFAGRHGDEVAFAFPMFSDALGREAYVRSEGSTTVLRDGEPVWEHPGPAFGEFTVPAEEASYTLRTEATRSGSPLSTKVNAEWTFRSGHVPGEEAKPLPLLNVRFASDLDDHNAAPAGKKFRFPVYVQRNGSAKPGRVDTPKLEVSYDDGTTWQPVRLKRDHDRWVATVDHPKDAQFVSLRSSVSDRDGNTASQTITRAYALK